MSSKQFGLQYPKKAAQPVALKPSIFGDDSDSDKSDSGGGGDWKKKVSKRDFSSAASRRQSRAEVEKALKEDATVFQYDEIYDEIDKQKQSLSGANKPKDRKPKYVQNLLVAAERRKMENERRYERQVQKEREQEGEEFKDKETFVTSAYKKKLEEFAKLDAEQMRQDMLEEIGDVTKQPDISGFYRHLYQTTVGGEKPKAEPEQDEEPDQDASDKARKSGGAGRQYRKRKDSHSSGDKNQDADSDLNSDSSSSSSSSSDQESGEISSHSDTEDPKRIRLKNKPSEKQERREAKLEKPSSGNSKGKNEDNVAKPVKSVSSIEEPMAVEDEEAAQVPPPSKEPQIDIWKKRTVGPVFDAALQRYLERKATRLSIGS